MAIAGALDLRAPWATSRPVVVGVAGDSASGKTTLATGIAWILGTERVTRLCADDYHVLDRQTRRALGITPLHPDANDRGLVERHLRTLAAGASVDKPVYDHATGELGDPVRIEPGEVIVVEGLHALGTRSLRDRYDVTVYLEPQEELRHRWKIDRDCHERGYDIADVVEVMRRQERDASDFVLPQRDQADIVVGFHLRDGADPYGELGASILLRPTLLHPELPHLVAAFAPEHGGKPGGRLPPVRVARRRGLGSPELILEVDGDCPAALGRGIERALWRRIRPGRRLQRERIGRYLDASGTERRSEALALVQLLVVAHVAGALEGSFEL